MIAAMPSQGQTYCILLLRSGSLAIPRVPLVVPDFVIAKDANDKVDWPCWRGSLESSAGQRPSVGVFLRVR